MATLPDLPQTEAAILAMTNAFRKESGLSAVKPNAALTVAARAFATYLASTGKFSHAADGRAPHERAAAHGYRYCLVAENLAANLDSRGFEARALARDVVEGWKLSPGHRANMLQAGATEIGVAVARAPDRTPKFISVQLLGRPESLKVEFSIENRAGAPVSYTLGDEAHTLSIRAIVTHTSCDEEQLTFAKPGVRFTPHDGNRFVVKTNRAGAIAVELERK